MLRMKKRGVCAAAQDIVREHRKSEYMVMPLYETDLMMITVTMLQLPFSSMGVLEGIAL